MIKSTYADADMINSLLDGHAPANPLREFKSAKWQYVNDNNNGGYGNGNIVFNTIHLRNVWKDWRNSYVIVPVSITGATTYDGDEVVAWKESVLSFFYGILLKINGVTVVSDDNIHYINNLRLLLKSKEWSDIVGPELMYAKDTNVATDATDATQYDATTVWASLTDGGAVDDSFSLFTTENPTYNDGLHKRSCFLRGDYSRFHTGSSTAPVSTNSLHFLNSSSQRTAGAYSGGSAKTISSDGYLASSYSFDMKVPLKYIHDFFDKLDFPLINDQLELTLMTTNNGSVDNFTPLMTPTGGFVPTISIRGPCRLYYRRVEFNSSDQQIINGIVSRGLEKEIHYIRTEWFQPQKANTSTSLTQLITSSAINPVRVWAINRPAGKSLLAVAGQSQIANVPATTSNLMVNNTKLFDSDLEFTHDHWEQFKEQLVDYTVDRNDSQITFLDYQQHFQGYHVYDLIRNKYNVLTKNSASELIWKCTKPGTSVDIDFIVERSAQVNINMGGDGMVSVIQG